MGAAGRMLWTSPAERSYTTSTTPYYSTTLTGVVETTSTSYLARKLRTCHGGTLDFRARDFFVTFECWACGARPQKQF